MSNNGIIYSQQSVQKNRKKTKIVSETFNFMSIDYLKSLATAMGFKLKEGQSGIWVKKYRKLDNYEIKLFLDKPNAKDCKIDYGSKIVIQRSTTCTFNQPESSVVLECVNRLLEKGYLPENLILEKDWPLGHKGKGFLDILVLDDKGKSFLMIECKTHGEEHRKEKIKMYEDGGQLFSYLIQEHSTQFLCLYSSRLEDGEIEIENDIVVVNDKIRSSKNQQESFEAWDQIFQNKGILEDDVQPYVVNFSGILKRDLKDLKSEDGGFIFNRFAEILRRNVVSDKTNAFNKIFNLFLCKIVDEYEKDDEEKLLFQWEEGETNEQVLLRLNDLYKKGMDLYLGLKIAAVTQEELDKELERVETDEGKRIIKELFVQQKLYTGNEFAFKEVFDKKSFEDNSIVVKEVVKLLEKYRIKYSSKHQFLGDFFEKLLNTGIKQEAGQFFTPIPITRFICKAIPLQQIIEDKNNKRDENFLPYVIDYASGSGHFLTEMMSEIDSYVSKIDDNWIKGGGLARKNFNKVKAEYIWAKEYVYGIEKDYRLAKTTKISTFLNGDGDANIICGDGLDNFKTSAEYVGKLKISETVGDNGQFDVLVANPPYSVSGFKNTLKNGEKSFSLYNKVTEQSSEIECFFIERAKQLIKPGGYVGIILPISLLSNGGIYTNTRDLLLRYFEIKGMVEFGSNTFMATGTNTITLFLKRRENDVAIKAENIISKFLATLKDVTCNHIENAFSKYVKSTYPKLTFEGYLNMLKGQIDTVVKKSEIYENYQSEFEKLTEVKKLKEKRDFLELSEKEREEELNDKFIQFVHQIEREKLLCFVLTYEQSLVLVKSGNKDDEKHFLGYEFSNRRGHEGIRLYKDTYLYDDKDLLNPNKVSSYILRNFLGETLPEIPDHLRPHIQKLHLHEMIDFERVNFEKKISTAFKKKLTIESKWGQTKLSKLEEQSKLEFVTGLVYGKNDEVKVKTQNRILTASNLDLETGRLDLSETLYLDRTIKIPNEKKLKTNDLFICTSSGSISHLGKNSIIEDDPDAYFGGFCGVLRSKDHNLITYLNLILNTVEFRNYVELQRGQNINNLGKQHLMGYKVPIPDDTTILKIVKETGIIHKKEKLVLEEITKAEGKINDLLQSTNGGATISLGQDFIFEYGSGLPERERVAGEYPVVGSNGVVGFHNEYLINGPAIIVGRKGSVGKVNLIEQPCYPIDTTYYVKFDETKFNIRYVYHLLKFINLEQLNNGIGPGGLNRNDAYEMRIPLLTTKEQEKLMSKITPLEKQIDNFKLLLLQINGEKRKVLDKYLE